MYRISKVALAVAVLLMVMTAGALAQAPNTLMYQGKLTDASMDPITVETDVIFSVWDSLTGGTPLAVEMIAVTPNEVGLFTVELGSTVPLPPGVFDGSKRYLEIQIVEDDPMTPRQLITSTPYSLQSNTPGVAHSTGSSYTITTAWEAFDSLYVNVPGPGYLVLEAAGRGRVQAYALTYGMYFYVSICDTTVTYNFEAWSYIYNSPDGSGSYHDDNFAIKWVVPVDAGTHSYFLTAYKYWANAAYMYDWNFIATYIPSWIGNEDPPEVTSPTLKAVDLNVDGLGH